jgi:hypothetical protein|nr:hypothetical protein [Kofleriaceae bacterium]
MSKQLNPHDATELNRHHAAAFLALNEAERALWYHNATDAEIDVVRTELGYVAGMLACAEYGNPTVLARAGDAAHAILLAELETVRRRATDAHRGAHALRKAGQS